MLSSLVWFVLFYLSRPKFIPFLPCCDHIIWSSWNRQFTHWIRWGKNSSGNKNGKQKALKGISTFLAYMAWCALLFSLKPVFEFLLVWSLGLEMNQNHSLALKIHNAWDTNNCKSMIQNPQSFVSHFPATSHKSILYF